MNTAPEKKDHGSRITGIADKFSLSEDQANLLDKANGRISSYSNLHDHISKSLATQLTSLCGKTAATADDLAGMGIPEGAEQKYNKVVLDSEVELPGGITLLPGTFIQGKFTSAFVSGNLEVRNQQGKSIGILLSQCSGSDYPAFFMRTSPADKVTGISWDNDNGPRMNAISDMWLQPQAEREYSTIETLVIGLMQANNKKKAEAEQSAEREVESVTEDIRKQLML